MKTGKARNPSSKRDYKQEYQNDKKNGAYEAQLERQKARRLYDKMGISREGKHIDHEKPVEFGGDSTRKNLRLRDPVANMRDNRKRRDKV